MSKLDDILDHLDIMLEQKPEAKQQIKDLMAELIGEDEPGEWPGKYSTDPEAYAKQHGEPTPRHYLIGGMNRLRAELRQRVNQL